MKPAGRAPRAALRTREAARRGTEGVARLCARLEASAWARGAVFALLLVAIGACMYILNGHTPLQMDDYDYSISWSTGEPVAGIADVIASQAVHYRLWGGRSVVHTLVQLFLYWGKGAFNAANAVAYLALLGEICALARPRGCRREWALLLTAHLFLFTCVPFFGTVFLWLDGACNYLWGTLIALWPLLIARSAREGGRFARGGVWGVLALPLCFVAGWTNENTACGVLALTALLLVWDGLSGRPMRAWRVAALVFQALGVAVMLLAPGNFTRASGYAYGNLPLELIRRLCVTAAYTVVYAGGLLVALVILFALARALGVAPRTGWALALAAGGLLAALAMVASPELSDRSFTGVLALLLAAVLSVMGDLCAGTRALDGAKWASLPLVLCLMAYAGYQAVGDVKAHEAAWAAQLACAQQAMEEGEAEVTLSGVQSHSRFTMDITLAQEPEAWPNSVMGRVLGIRIRGR